MIKVGALVKYIPSPSSLFKWEQYVNSEARNPGIVLREIEGKGSSTRRFEIRWQNGKTTEEWITYLEIFE